jgi:hypothetical protein
VTKAYEEIGRLLGLKPKLDAEILLLEVATGRKLAHAADSTLLFYSPDGMTLATGEPDGSTRLRDIPGQSP